MKKEFSNFEKTQYKFLLNLLSSLICRSEFNENVVDFDFQQLYNITTKNKVANIVSYAFDICNVSVQKEVKEKFLRCRKFFLMKDASQYSATQKLIDEFESKGIDNLLVKGQFIKDTYPQPDYRVMNDIDIHIKNEDINIARDILVTQGYTIQHFSEDLIVAIQEPFVQFEIHCDNGNFLDTLFTDGLFCVADLVDNKKHTYKLSDEYHYIYIVEHFAKHYRDLGGMGLKMLLDIYFLNKAFQQGNIDRKFIEKKLRENKLSKFHSMLINKSTMYFEKAEINFDDIDIYILSNMTFGTKENYIYNGRRYYNKKYENQSDKYLLSRLFPPYKRMVSEYTGLENKKFLLPFYWLHRCFKIIISKNVKSYTKNISDYKKYNNREDIEYLNNVMKKSGL